MTEEQRIKQACDHLYWTIRRLRAERSYEHASEVVKAARLVEELAFTPVVIGKLTSMQATSNRFKWATQNEVITKFSSTLTKPLEAINEPAFSGDEKRATERLPIAVPESGGGDQLSAALSAPSLGSDQYLPPDSIHQASGGTPTGECGGVNEVGDDHGSKSS